MKLKKFFMLFTALTLTNLLQVTYACTTINPGDLSAFKIAPRNSYKIIDSKITSSDKRKAPKKITPGSLSAFKIAPRNSYKIIDDKIMPADKRKTPSNGIMFFDRHKDCYKFHEFKEYKLEFKEEIISPDNTKNPSSSKSRRCNFRCKCPMCGWTGYPDHYYSYLRCKGCRHTYQECRSETSAEIILCPENELPGLKLNRPYNLEPIHNGFIYDNRLSQFHGICKDHLEIFKNLKKSNAQVWFYCYSCKDYFLVPINDIQHPADILNYLFVT